jgi:hypothetical protein
MPEHPMSVDEVARRVRVALESADLAALGDLLDPNVRWGPPGDPSPPCQSREQVLAWYGRARQTGARARVAEVTVLENHLLVGLDVTGTPAAGQRGGHATRWQVLTVRHGRIVDVVGFDQRSEATAHVTVSPT